MIDEALEENSLHLSSETLLNLKDDIIYLRSLFYDYHENELVKITNKYSLLTALASGKVDANEIEIMMRNYLRNLRNRLESLADRAFKLDRVLRHSTGQTPG